MRTTISLDDQVGRRARRRATEEGTSLSALIARLLTEYLARPPAPETKPFKLVTVAGPPRPGVDLDRISEFLVDEESEPYRRGGN